jgi:hypothetical protein
VIEEPLVRRRLHCYVADAPGAVLVAGEQPVERVILVGDEPVRR